MKKFISIMLVAAMAVTALTGCGSNSGSSSKKDADKYYIGGIGPTTGATAIYGTAVKNGAQIEVDENNAAGGINGKQIEAVLEDDENKPATAPNAVTKLLEQDKVDIVLGSYASSCSIAMAPIVNEAQKIMISVGSTNAKVTAEGGEYIFRACFIDPLQGKVAATFAKNTLKAD